MKAVLLPLLLLVLGVAAQESKPSGVRVPDEATAVDLAERALVKVYGKYQIDYEKPLTAKLENGVWNVYGTLCCPGPNGQRTCEPYKCVGGVAALQLRQSDGKVLSVSHTK